MNAAKLVKEVERFMQSNASAEVVEKYARYFKEGYDAYGVPSGVLPKYRDEFIDKYSSKLDLDGWMELCGKLMASEKFEIKGMAYVISMKFASALGRERMAEIRTWFAYDHHNWAICDEFSCAVFPAMFEAGSISTADFEPWRDDLGRWVRRVAIVSQIKPMKAERKAKRYLKFVEPMMAETERVAQQGIGWFLREAWKIDATETEKLLLKYKNIAARLIYQAACEKMDNAGKARFRRDK